MNTKGRPANQFFLPQDCWIKKEHNKIIFDPPDPDPDTLNFSEYLDPSQGYNMLFRKKKI